MKLHELFADKLLQTPLMEMAVERADAIKKIMNIEYRLNENLIKYLYFDDQAKNHWITEIKGFILPIDDILLKPKNKRLSKEIYFKELFENSYGQGTQSIIKRIKSFLVKDYSKCGRTGLSIEQVHWAMKQFYIWLCPLLEADEYSNQSDEDERLVQSILDELIIKAKRLN